MSNDLPNVKLQRTMPQAAPKNWQLEKTQFCHSTSTISFLPRVVFHERWGNYLEKIVSLSKDVFKRRTSTGSGFFHLWAVVFPKFSLSRLHSSKETFNTNFLASRYFKMKNTSLPVDERRSKTTLPKLLMTEMLVGALRNNELQILVSLKALRTESQ